MIISPLSQQPNGRDVEFVIRLDRTITRLGAPLGYGGDPLAERFPDGRTFGDLHAARELMRLLPVELRNWDRRVALRMCQAAVFGRTRPEDRSLAPQELPKPTADAKLARERNRGKSRRSAG